MAASSWDKLGQAASVTQLVGVDAFSLVAMIVQAAYTVGHNRDLCQQLAKHVQIVGGLLRKLQIPELRRDPETRQPLDQLNNALLRAYELVKSCSQHQEKSSKLYQMFRANDVAAKLRAVQEEINFYIQLIPLITVVVVVDRGNYHVQEDVTVGDSVLTWTGDDSTILTQSRRFEELSLQEGSESLLLEGDPASAVEARSYETIGQAISVVHSDEPLPELPREVPTREPTSDLSWDHISDVEIRTSRDHMCAQEKSASRKHMSVTEMRTDPTPLVHLWIRCPPFYGY